MKQSFPVHGSAGIVLLLLSEIFLFKKTDPFYSWFFCFAWWSYIFAVDGIVYWKKGNSLIVNRRKEFLLMIPWSVFIWLIFEAANLSLENWYYINLPRSPIERWLGYAIAYGTVLPGLFETMELLAALGLFNQSKIRPVGISTWGLRGLILSGAACLSSSVLMPSIFFPLIWVGFTFLLEPFNHRLGGRSLLSDLGEGNPVRLYRLLVAGGICGVLWEFWNFWSLSKWVYTVPFFENRKGFEMPLLGFLGFLPFAVQAHVMYRFISLFRFGRSWEGVAARFQPAPRTRGLTIVLTAILMVSFFVLMFQKIDSYTVDSLYPRLKDAYWIEPRFRDELPKVGIASLEDLVQKTNDKIERDEWALRLLVPKEEFIPWIERARLALLKGLGIENLRRLEGVGISSVETLASQDPEKLHALMSRGMPEQSAPRLAKIRVWVREAQKGATLRGDP